MLTFNDISIYATASVMEDIYSKMHPASVEADIRNYHSYSVPGAFLDILSIEGDHGFEWAYVESCTMQEDCVNIIAYSFKGNLAAWTKSVRIKYVGDQENQGFYARISINKSVAFKSYS